MAPEDQTVFQSDPAKAPQPPAPAHTLAATEAAPSIDQGVTEADPSVPTAGKETVQGLKTNQETIKDPTAPPPPPQPLDVGGTLTQDPRSQAQAAQISQEHEIPPVVPGYRLTQKIGHGTYGVVWKGEEANTGTQVAIKFFHRRGLHQWQQMEAEIKQLADLKGDPGIIQIFDADLNAQPAYFVMDFAEQGCLTNRLKHGPLPVADALELFRQIVEAMAYVHDKGIRHCDLKPGNVLLDSRGRARVADFGQAHLSIDVGRAHLGTFFYMPPDQAEDTKQIADTRWDVYALGALFFRMVVGKPPRHQGQVEEELARTLHLESRLNRYRQVVLQAAKPAEHRYLQGMDGPLADIIDRCLEINPAKRFRSAGAVLQALNQRDRRKRLRPLLIFGVLAPLLLLVALGLFAWRMIGAAVAGSEASLIDQFIKNDRVAASLAATVLEDKLDLATARIVRYVQSDKLLKALRAYHQDDKNPQRRLELDEQVHKFHEFSDYHYVSWTLFDSRGKLLTCALRDDGTGGKKKVWFSESVRDQYFHWRDYFNHEGDKYGHPSDAASAFEFRLNLQKDETGAFVDVPYLSQPYRSRTTEGDSMFACMTLSKGVVDPDNPARVLGVLTCSIKLSEFNAWLDPIEANSGGCAVVLDRRLYAVHHRQGLREALLPSPKEPPRILELTQELKTRQQSEHHIDPIDHGHVYLAAYRHVPKYDLHVIVQHRRDQALAGVAELRHNLTTSTWIAGLASAAILSAFWGWLLWLLLRKDNVAKAVA